MKQSELLNAYESMRLIRSFEEMVVGLVNKNEIAGVTHEYIGQEAVAVGMCATLGPNDVLTSTHRGHGHLLARGASPAAMLAELLGRESGLNAGRGGSMHIADVSLGVYGANGIVGAGVPFALGASSVQDGPETRIAVAFFGDGALNQGVLLESMNLAKVWGLPVVFCCENNGYAVTMPSSRATSVTPVERAAGFGIPGRTVNGMDVADVSAAATEAITWARNGFGPYFLDCQCYRFVGHHTAESTMKLSYRTQEEIDLWRLRDPLLRGIELLADSGVPPETVSAIDNRVDTILAEALDLAMAGIRPAPESALDFLYSSPTLVRWGTS